MTFAQDYHQPPDYVTPLFPYNSTVIDVSISGATVTLDNNATSTWSATGQQVLFSGIGVYEGNEDIQDTTGVTQIGIGAMGCCQVLLGQEQPGVVDFLIYVPCIVSDTYLNTPLNTGGSLQFACSFVQTGLQGGAFDDLITIGSVSPNFAGKFCTVTGSVTAGSQGIIVYNNGSLTGPPNWVVPGMVVQGDYFPANTLMPNEGSLLSNSLRNFK